MKISSTFAAFALTSLSLTACGNPDSDAQSGDYIASTLVAGDPMQQTWEPAPPLRLHVEREPDRLTLKDEDGALVFEGPLTAREERFLGCPGNVSAMEMEVLELGVPHLSLAGLELDNPILVADCTLAGIEGDGSVVLRDAGEGGIGFNNACEGAVQGCISFYLEGGANDPTMN